MDLLNRHPSLSLALSCLLVFVVCRSCWTAWRLRRVRSFNIDPQAHAYFLRSVGACVHGVAAVLIVLSGSLPSLLTHYFGFPIPAVVACVVFTFVVGIYVLGIGYLIGQRAEKQLVGFTDFPKTFDNKPLPALPPGSRLDHLPGQSSFRGAVLLISGSLLCTVAAVVTVTCVISLASGRFTSWVPLTAVLVLLSGPLYSAGTAVRRSGRRHLTKVLRSPRQLNDGAFVLYLRPFKDDTRLSSSGDSWTNLGMPIMVHLLRSGRSEEEVLARVLKPLGMLVAVGTPAETVPYVGAVRVYLPSDPPDAWKEPVRDLMLRARMVVIALGPGEGTLWELAEAMRVLPPERLVLIVPMSEHRFEDFRAVAAEALRGPPSRRLPDYKMTQGNQAEIKGIIHFSNDWEPEFVSTHRLGIDGIRQHTNGLYHGLRLGLRPAFRKLLLHEQGGRVPD